MAAKGFGDRRCVRISGCLLVALAVVAKPSPADAEQIRHLAGVIEPDPARLEAAIERCERDALLLESRGIDRIHLLAQFDGNPDAARRRALEHDGVRFGGYLPRHAWIVSVPVTGLTALVARGQIRWLQPWSSNLKLHPRVASRNWNPWSVDPGHPGRVVVFVQLHHDVDLARGGAIAEAHGGKAFDPVTGLHGLPVLIDEQAIGLLAAEEKAAGQGGFHGDRLQRGRGEKEEHKSQPRRLAGAGNREWKRVRHCLVA